MCKLKNHHFNKIFFSKIFVHSLILIHHEKGVDPVPSLLLSSSEPSLQEWTFLATEGNWLKNGYLSGFQEIIDQNFNWCEENDPTLIENHQHSLKRLFTKRKSLFFTIPKDLTNTSSDQERTRFYHHEYQNKLLVGLAEFLLSCQELQKKNYILIIKEAHHLSPTALNLIRILMRLPKGKDFFKIILLDSEKKVFLNCIDAELYFPRFKLPLLDGLFPETYSTYKKQKLYEMCRGNPSLINAVVTCNSYKINREDYLSPSVMVDLYLAVLSPSQRKELLKNYIGRLCTSDDYILIRNYETASPLDKDLLHEFFHLKVMDEYFKTDAPLILFHAYQITNPQKKLNLLTIPSKILEKIGLYDTWFSYFSALFSNNELRLHGTGDCPENSLFISASFILYSLGCGTVSIPYMDLFYKNFPNSRYVPTALYAQSMTYGRYQKPVNLPLAEKYALHNLEIINKNFKNHDQYHYIKIFAENAYAYIKAKQGKYSEALDLCLNGKQHMLDIYGNEKYKLHQSILIYNTSQIYELINDFKNAEKYLKLAIDYDPNYGEYYNDLANLLSNNVNRANDVLELYQKAIDLCPPYYEAFLNRGIFLNKIGRTDGALDDFNRVLQIKPDEFRAFFEIGNSHFLSGNFRKAKSNYLHALSIDPNDPELCNNLGLIYSELKIPEKGIFYYNKAITLKPYDPIFHNNIAIEYFSSGKCENALLHAKRATELENNVCYIDTYKYILDHGRP